MYFPNGVCFEKQTPFFVIYASIRLKNWLKNLDY
jgi:hypothetical protein